MPLSEEEELQRYTVRLRPRAVRDLDTESVRLAELEGDTIALDWLAKLKTAIGPLITWPRRFPLAEDAGIDGFVVRIRHIRHGASPLSTYDAGELLTDA